MRTRNNLRISGIYLLLLAAVAMLGAGCGLQGVEVGPLVEKEKVVESGPVGSVEVAIAQSAGQLNIDGGAGALMEANFASNVADWRPEVSYTVDDSRGRLSVSQMPAGGRLPLDFDKVRNDWTLRFNEKIPLDLAITMGAGDANLELDELLVGSLVFKGGAGDVSIDLSGSTATELDIGVGAGSLTVDLSGSWDQDLSAVIRGGIGRTTILLPRDSGVRVDVLGGLSQVKAPDLIEDGKVYTNETYGSAGVTLSLVVESGAGEIILRLSE
jgi:hypothetical protein